MVGRLRREGLLLLALWGLSLPLLAQPRGLPPDTYRRILRSLNRPELRPAWVGLVVSRRDTGDLLLARHPNSLFMPASTLKLITTAAALGILGGDFRFQTRVMASEPWPEDGLLRGDLYLVGGGDPSFDLEHLEALAQELRRRGLKEVQGGVVGDESLFQGPRWGYGWNWDDLPWYYSPEVTALSVHRNLFTVVVKPGAREGEAVQVEVDPATNLLMVQSSARTGPAKSASSLRLWREPGEGILRIEGLLPLDASALRQACALPRPALFAVQVWTEMLRGAGIEVAQPPRLGQAPTDASLWLTHLSPPLRDLLPRLNKFSDNHYAEQIFRMIGVASGKGGEPHHAREEVMEFLRSQGMEVASVRIVDGSGLSRFNLVTPCLLAQVLHWLARHPEFEAVWQSLPIAGRDGTLASRLRGTAAEGRARAKTGTLGNVSCLAGYVETADGVPLILVLLLNHFTCPRSVALEAQDEVVRALAECRLRPREGSHAPCADL